MLASIFQGVKSAMFGMQLTAPDGTVLRKVADAHIVRERKEKTKERKKEDITAAQ